MEKAKYYTVVIPYIDSCCPLPHIEIKTIRAISSREALHRVRERWTMKAFQTGIILGEMKVLRGKVPITGSFMPVDTKARNPKRMHGDTEWSPYETMNLRLNQA